MKIIFLKNFLKNFPYICISKLNSMEINFNNPDFDGILQKAGFTRKEVGSTIFTNGGVTIDLAKGINTVNLRKIVDCAFKNGGSDKVKQIKDILE